MANQEHLEILKQGAEAWNKWREENPEILPNLIDADLIDADLRDSNLYNADLYDANLSGADLSHAALGGANLSRVDLSGASLKHVRLWDANILSANLENADFAGAQLSWTIFSDINLSNVKGLDSVRHDSPSEIGINTFYKSKGQIPEVFLRGCGLADWEIEAVKLYSPNLTQGQISEVLYKMHELRTNPAIQFYSCFISYSSKNHSFAGQLYADLQSIGVRCWFAPEDLKIGEKIRVGIDESIRMHDKLLLILSKHSVESVWVEKEVETAMEQERKQKRMVLFPVMLDNSVMKMESGWPADIRRSRNMGDFRKWKDRDSYQKAFNRLLRDLKAGEVR